MLLDFATFGKSANGQLSINFLVSELFCLQAFVGLCSWVRTKRVTRSWSRSILKISRDRKTKKKKKKKNAAENCNCN